MPIEVQKKETTRPRILVTEAAHDIFSAPEKKTAKYVLESENMYEAMMNIFEDLNTERSGSVDTQKAVMNILEDLQEEVALKNRFLAVLSHELRNPLAPITSTLEYIKLSGVENTELKESIETIEHQFGVLTRLLKDLLDVARISSNKLRLNIEEVSLQAIINHAIHSTRPLIEKAKHTLHVSLPAESVRFYADSLRFEQIVVNLLSNAVKYTEHGGTIYLTARLEKKDVSIEIRDTGIGIDPPMLSKIFNLFTQQESASMRFGGGLGVGLALVRSLVELHGGSVHATSKGLGQGSTFTVRLPRTQPFIQSKTAALGWHKKLRQ
jgi:signal transduction histidine kinase